MGQAFKGFSLGKLFNAKVAAAALSVSALTSGCSTTTGAGNGPLGYPENASNDICIKLDETRFDPGKEEELGDMLRIAKQSPTASRIFNELANARVKLCYEPDLQRSASVDGLTLGNYLHHSNRINLNPDYSIQRLMETLVHEGRHGVQGEREIEWSQRGNIPLEQRVIIQWLNEADARLSGIVFAYEMQQAGEGRYMRELKQDSWYRPMVLAFERSLRKHPNDMQEAMRSAIRAFRDTSGLARHYGIDAVHWIKENKRTYDPNKKTKDIVTRETLMRLGEMSPNGNYMNDELIEFIRGSVTAEDYKDLVRAHDRKRFDFDAPVIQGPPPNRMID